MQKIILILFLSFFINCDLYPQQGLNLRAELTPELFNEYDTYIRTYAPADSAYNVVAVLANKHFVQRRAGVAAYIFNLYKPLFPHKTAFFENEIKLLYQIMLSQTASMDMFPVYVDFIKKNSPSDDAFFALQRIADFYIIRQEWDSATVVYNSFKPYFKIHERKINKIVELLTSPLQGLEIKNLGPNINTNGSEWDPSPTTDDRFLYFTADQRIGGRGGADIWVSEKINGEWTKAKNLNKPINNYLDETVDNVTADGTGLLLSGNFQGTYGEFDIYLAEKDSAGWKDLMHYPIPLNSEYHDESGCITADSKAIFFTSDRPGGIGPYFPISKQFYGGGTMGNMDIYVCPRTENGWGKPINLGKSINTPYSERAAYLHPDGKTLYFSSNGHYGLGRLDVYKSTRLSDTSWTEWSEPINLGKEINSAQDDWGYVVDTDGEFAYFAKDSDMDGYGNWDIYSIRLPDAAKPSEVVVIRGQVTDSLGRALESIIIWEDLESGEKVGNLKSDPRDGFFIITLPLGKSYGYYASKPGYFPSSKSIDLRKTAKVAHITENITLISIHDMQERGSRVRINNIFFDFDKSELKETSLPELKRLLVFANDLKKYKIIIEGYTDNTGSDNHNQKLSLERAKAVENYLIVNGISPDRINATGLGSNNPIAPNDNDDNKALNRRVEIRLTKL